MLAVLLVGFLLPLPCAFGATTAAEGKEIYSCTFQKELGPPWRIIGGKWEVKDGRLRQVDPQRDDPNKTVLVLGDAEELSTGIVLTAKLRIDAWSDDEWARAGIGCCCDPQSGHGLNLVFHQGQLQFVHDYIAWGPGCRFAYTTGKWYWLKLCRTPGELQGKAWADGDPEPADWMVVWNAADPELTGYPALVGCSGNPAAGRSTVSFAQCRVAAVGGSPAACYTKKATWYETMFASSEALAREEAQLAAQGLGKTEHWGPWHWIGPFQGGRKSAFAEVFPPETEIDLKRAYGPLRWTARPDWSDGAVHYDLPVGDNIATYLHRTVNLKDPKTVTGYFGSDDGLAVWLNGKRVIANDVARSAAPNQDQARLELRAGENHLLVKIHDHTGPSGFYFSTSPEPGLANNPRRERLWTLLERDFSDRQSGQQMAWERQDRIWSGDWPADAVRVLAGRYAAAARAGFAQQARELAKSVKTEADLDGLRRLYDRSREVEETLARWTDSNPQSLRLAVEDLVRTFGARYPGGPERLARLDRLEKRLAAARAAGSQAADQERLFELVQEFERLRAEALFANPLLDFARLALIKRRDARDMKPRPRLRGDGAIFAGNDLVGFLNGLPINFQGNGYLREVSFDNEIALLSPVRPGGRLATLYRPEKPVYVGDLKLHFDADRLLFSSVGAHDRWQIFEIGVDGKGFRQVTRGDPSDVDSYDACYLPDGRILFASSACFQSVPCERRCDEVANFCVMQSDGSGIRRLCFDQDHNFYPSVMADGRILYTRWEYTDIAHAFTGRLMTMNPDGTMQRGYYASGSFWPNRIFYARPIPEHPTKFVGIVTGHHGTARAGELIVFDVAAGRRRAEGAVQRIPGRGKPVEAKMVDALVDGSWPKFLHPCPLSDKYFLVSCQPSPQSRWGIYLADVFDNLVLLYEEEGWVLFDPVPVRTTPRPPVLPDKTHPTSREATVYLSDVYSGEGLKGVPRGTVRRLRLFTYHFNYYGTSGIEDYVGMDGPWDVRRVLGTVPVAEDGSAYFAVPANTPIAVQPLDAEGKAIQLMRSWFTAMPGEAVSCVGCHEHANTTPPKSPRAALGREPTRITPWRGPVRGFSWDREVQPVLDRYCVGCHDGRPQAGGKALVDLRRALPRSMPLSPFPFPPSFYELRRLVRSPGLEGPSVVPLADYHADANALVQMLRKGHHNVRLDEEAWDRLVTWIDMNAPAYGTWLEIPTVRDREQYLRRPTVFFSAGFRPLSVSEIDHYRQRRKELLWRYGGVEDDPEAVVQPPPESVSPVVPPPERPAEVLRVDGWPFGTGEAKRRQAAAGARTQLEIDLGAGGKLELALIPAGEFVMGDPAGYPDERPLSRVKIDRPFWMGKFEVTNRQYAAFDPAHQSGVEPMLWLKWHPGHLPALNQPNQPVCRVSWHEANNFCQWLSQKSGRKFALPSEAQWEWACRAGTDTALSFGSFGTDATAFANLADVSLLNLGKLASMEKVRPFFPVDSGDDKNTVSAPVGSYRPNCWGLHDMHGNVAEWTASTDLPYPFRGDDPRHAAANERKVVRGGSWRQPAQWARSGCRTSYASWQPVFDVGIRVICEAP